MQALTTQKAASLTSVNLVKLLIDEYIMVAIETQTHEHAAQELLQEVNQLTLPPPHQTGEHNSGTRYT